MVSSKPFFVAAILAMTLACSPVAAVQEIKETRIISGFLRENVEACKMIHRTVQEMLEDARPFMNPHHQAKYRFGPGDKHGRSVMSTSRSMAARFKFLRGILCHAPMPNRENTFKGIFACIDAIGVAGKRSLRAVKDGNFALYMASAQSIEKEVFGLDKLVKDLEDMVNSSIQATDSKMEDL